MSSKTAAFESSKCHYVGPPGAGAGCPKCGAAWKHVEVFGTGHGSAQIKRVETKSSQVRKNNVSETIDVSFPHDFLLPSISLDDVTEVKLWSARFFVKQLTVLWGISVPVQFPNTPIYWYIVVTKAKEARHCGAQHGASIASNAMTSSGRVFWVD